MRSRGPLADGNKLNRVIRASLPGLRIIACPELQPAASLFPVPRTAIRLRCESEMLLGAAPSAETLALARPTAFARNAAPGLRSLSSLRLRDTDHIQEIR